MEETRQKSATAMNSQGDAPGGDGQKDKYMTFKSGSEYFGLKLECVNEIIQFQTITMIPETEDYIRGLINLRGKVIPVIDAQLRFGQPAQEYNDRTCIIVINVKSTIVGVIVEEIAEVVEIREENILPPPAIGQRGREGHHDYVYGIGKVGRSVKLLLDPERLLYDEEQADGEQEGEEDEEG